jgi:hypothetical protein
LTKTWGKRHVLRLADIDSKIKSKVHESETPCRAAALIGSPTVFSEKARGESSKSPAAAAEER